MTHTANILVVDDEHNILSSLKRLLELEGYSVLVAGGGRMALEKLTDQSVQAVLLDVRMEDMGGLETLEVIREKYPELPVIMMSGHSSLDVAVQALRTGAVDFIEKPVGAERLLVSLKNALKITHLQRENRDLTARLSTEQSFIGESRAMKDLKDAIELAAPSRARVLITGENGTGKELIARAIHQGSDRNEAPFIKVNCAAIPSELIESELFGHEKGAFTGASQARKGKFELAHGGTLFLDEIGDMRLEVQAKLLRVLQEEEFERVGGSHTIRVDTRILAATNKDLAAAIAAGEFREDLYYRLNVVPMHAAPLRERKEDIARLAEHFVANACVENNRRAKTISESAMDVLSQHRWPGNVRELKNTCERLVILVVDDQIEAHHVQRLLPDFQRSSGTDYESGKALKDLIADAERRFIQAALSEYDGHVTKAATALGLERSHLYKKMKSLGLR